MAFKNLSKVFYSGSVKIDYLDKPHAYYGRNRVDYDLPEDDPNAWSKTFRPKGCTTLLGDTLEHNGLFQWPKGVALRELFGFYDFTNEKGDRMTGFSKEVGTLWKNDTTDIKCLHSFNESTALPLVQSAANGWKRKQKKGADIGSVVHDAIEHYIKDEPFDIAENYMWTIKESEYESDAARDEALLKMPEETLMAENAFAQFKVWWESNNPELLGAEDLIYSKQYNICGTFDGLIKLNGKTILCDWKTSNASKSEEAAMWEGIGYSYFIQSAIYAMAWMEMGNDPIDDLMIVSCRKDGGFTAMAASDLDLTVQECIDWAKAVITCFTTMNRAKTGLRQHAIATGQLVIQPKKGAK